MSSQRVEGSDGAWVVARRAEAQGCGFEVDVFGDVLLENRSVMRRERECDEGSSNILERRGELGGEGTATPF